MYFTLKHTFHYKLFIELLVIKMFEQMAVMTAKSNAALTPFFCKNRVVGEKSLLF